ncbi:MAG: hypothetical protein SVU32_03410, partial [Candidatus Nanohaloarchaea archaeon]|nr:hypothetical protein [Candidatus Nanohaloarchaea archaeon]
MNKLLTALITAFVVAGFIGTTANAVSTATLPETAMVPGDALYDTKRSLEESIESLAPNKSAKAKAKIE